MGFRPQLETIRIEFVNPEHPFHGLIIRCRPITVGHMLEGSEAAELIILQRELQMMDPEQITKQFIGEAIARVRKPFEHFLESLIEWNLEDPITGDEIAPTMEGVRKVGLKVMVSILREWQTAVGGVNDDLKADSSSGPSAPVLSLPMDPL